MKVEFRKQFVSNMLGIKDKHLADEIEFAIENIFDSNAINEIIGIKKLTGFKDYYRIKIGDYRIGIKISGKTAIVICLLHRSVIYKHFP